MAMMSGSPHELDEGVEEQLLEKEEIEEKEEEGDREARVVEWWLWEVAL